MADVVDLAGQIEADTIAAAVARAVVPLRPGAAGECEQCGWWMPRLVDGLCAFCRDGRRRPDDWEPPTRPDQPAAPDAPPSTETTTMPHPAGTKSITIAASGPILEAVQKRTAGGATSANRAVLDLIEVAIEAMDVKAASSATPASDVRTPRQRMVALLDGVSELLIEQIDAAARPSIDPDLVADRDAWKARADEAESKLAQMKALFA